MGALLILGVGLRRAGTVKIVAVVVSLIPLGMAALWFGAFRPPVARHDRDTSQLQADLVELVREQMPDASVVRATRAVDNRASAGGYCSYNVTLSLKTSRQASSADALLQKAAARRGPDWMYLSIRDDLRKDTLLVDAERLGEGGTLDPRCG